MRTLARGEKFGTLTVLGPVAGENLRYRVGCTCGNSAILVTARQFDKGKARCRKCARGSANRT